jgi:hypothetical protein
MKRTANNKPLIKKINMRIVLITIVTFLTSLLYGQNSSDYVILRHEYESAKPDTIFGKIGLPENGIILKVKIQTNNGKEKYKIKETIGFRAGEVYFASLKYNKGYVFAPRLIEGEIDLYFYYSGTGGYTYLFSGDNLKADLISNSIGLAYEAVAVSMTSYYYIYDSKTDNYYRVPHSSKKFLEQISDIFKDNTDIYNKILNGTYKPHQIAEIVELYNNSKTKI